MTTQMTQQAGHSAAAGSVQDQVNNMIEELIASLPAPSTLTSDERRGIIARYSAVLEGNFIYWMTAALIAVKTEEAREELIENLHEEVKDAHPAMLRRFAIAAHAYPTDADAMAINRARELRSLRDRVLSQGRRAVPAELPARESRFPSRSAG